MNPWAFWITHEGEPAWGPFDSEIEAYDYATIHADDTFEVEYRDFPYDEELAP